MAYRGDSEFVRNDLSTPFFLVTAIVATDLVPLFNYSVYTLTFVVLVWREISFPWNIVDRS